jgi:TolB protein
MNIMQQFIKIFILFVIIAMPSLASARVLIDINNPNTDPLPLALPTFSGTTKQEERFAKNLQEVIAADLQNSTLFKIVDPAAHLQTTESIQENGPIFNEWRLINAEGLLTGEVELVNEDGAEKLRVSFRFYDVAEEKQLVGWRYKVDAKFWRYVAHLIADRVYNVITGEPGYFATRIVYIGEEQSKRNGFRAKKLCVMDQDGASQQCLTNGDHLVLTPRFNPQAQKIIYMSYANGKPRLYLLDLPTGKQELLGDFEGLNSSPRFAPDGKSVVMTLTKGHEGNPEIYRMDLKTRELTRLTFHRGIDTSPSFSPDGKQIVFNSDRGGKPNLYIMDAEGQSVQRLTFGRGSYYAPEWSPRGDLIAFVRKLGGRFNIGVIDTEGREERLLTDSFLDESPTWSPNGRVIAFARQMGDSTRIYTIDLTGYNERQLPTPTDASDPAWSPLLK